jgi:hypothetical protein
MANCKVCGVETSNGKYCKSCERDVSRIDAHKEADWKETVRFLVGLPSHLFFYGLKYLLMDRVNGITLNEYLLYSDENNGAPVWQRLKDYRCGREGDRWDTNPLLA